MKASALVAQFKTFPPLSSDVDPATAAYGVYVMGNRKITDILKRRPKSEIEGLRKFEDDKREVFDGLQGANESVGALVRYELLKEEQ